MAHPLLRDIALLFLGSSIYIVRYVYRDANSVADWVASFLTNHSGSVLWMDPRML